AGITEGRLPAFAELSKFPEVRRDIAVVVKQSVVAGDLLQRIRDEAGPVLKNLRLFDAYQGKGIDPEGKSLAIGLTLQHSPRTPTDGGVNATLESVLGSLQQDLNAILRR